MHPIQHVMNELVYLFHIESHFGALVGSHLRPAHLELQTQLPNILNLKQKEIIGWQCHISYVITFCVL